MNRVSKIILGVWVICMMIGCYSNYSGGSVSETFPESDANVIAEASLFDCRLFRQGKWNSFRLETYLTDTLAGLAGRGYLGKGALKGRLTTDSIAVYFPTTNEFLSESFADLTARFDCGSAGEGVDLLRLFSSLPRPSLSLLIETDSTASNRRDYNVRAEECDWQLDLSYDLRDADWRLRQFEFDDGRGNRLRGQRRTFKPRTEVPRGRFELSIPPGAVRITP